MKPYYLYSKGNEIKTYPASNGEKLLKVEDLVEMFKNIYAIAPLQAVKQ
jgi:hypothetical protein